MEIGTESSLPESETNKLRAGGLNLTAEHARSGISY